MADCRWLIHSYRISPEEATHRYGIEIVADTESTEDTLERQFENLVSGSGYSENLTNQSYN